MNEWDFIKHFFIRSNYRNWLYFFRSQKKMLLAITVKLFSALKKSSLRQLSLDKKTRLMGMLHIFSQHTNPAPAASQICTLTLLRLTINNIC